MNGIRRGLTRHRYFLCIVVMLVIIAHSKTHTILDSNVTVCEAGAKNALPWRQYGDSSSIASIRAHHPIMVTKANLSISDNLVGCQRWSFAEDFEDMLATPNNGDILASVAIGTLAESTEYISNLPYTLTRANVRLGNATQKGRPFVADQWAQSDAIIWQLPMHHPRNSMRRECVALSKEAGKHPVNIYVNRSALLEPFYMVKMKNAFIHDTGIIGLECGYWQAHEGCETIFRFLGEKWRAKCDKSLTLRKKSWSQMLDDIRGSRLTQDNYYGCPTELVVFRPRKKRRNQPTMAPSPPPRPPLPQFYPRVLAITANWDNNYHHFIVDCMLKLIRYMDFVQAHPDIKIHIRTTEKFARKPRYVAGGIALRRRILELLGIDTGRLINGSVVANEVFVPRSTVCNSQVSHALELRLLSKFMLSKAFKCQQSALLAPTYSNSAHLTFPMPDNSRFHTGSTKKKLILQHRHCQTKSECDATWREWDMPTFLSVKQAFTKIFHNHDVVVMSSSDSASVDCLDCQIQDYAQADVIVGIHGAGMTNVMFMPPESLLVEIVGQFDGRMLPLCGYHGPLNSIFGIHHYVYYYDWKAHMPLDPLTIAREAMAFYRAKVPFGSIYSDLESQ